MKRNKLLAIPLAIALGLEIITPGREEGPPHTEKEIALAPEAQGEEADTLRPFATPPENPWLSDFALRVIMPEELEGWWVNTAKTHTGGYVTVMRTQTCGEARFKEDATLHNPNTNQDVTMPVYLNQDYCISWRTRKMCEMLAAWLLKRGVTAQVVWRVDNKDSGAPDYRTLASSYAAIYDDGDGPDV